MTHRRRHLAARGARALAGSVMSLLVLVPVAQAACPAPARADTRATALIVEQLRSTGAPGASDVSGLYARSRRSCLDARPVRAIAAATHRLGVPAEGRRATVRGVPLVGIAIAGGVAWRLDLKPIAVRVSTFSDRTRVAQHVALLRSAGSGAGALTFSADPTRVAWEPKAQAVVATVLGSSVHADARVLGDAAVRGFAVGRRAVALGRLPLLEHLVVANRVANVGVRSTDARTDAVVANVALRAMVRIRAARARGWSRIDGAWASGPDHRALVAQSTLLLRRHPHAATGRVVAELRRTLRTPTTVAFGTLPVAEFYPWPRDEAFDTQSVNVDVDRPATVSLLIYATGNTPIRTVSTTTEPGQVTLTWDGADATGAIQPAGDYRYNVDAVDPLGRRARVAGLERFRVARDTTAPTVQTATVRLIGSGAARRVVASWAVTEAHSPKVTTWLLLSSGARTERIQLHAELQRATVRRAISLPAGTWRATMVFGDGSGNRVSRTAGSFEIRAGSS